jgi:hypothetical protein
MKKMSLVNVAFGIVQVHLGLVTLEFPTSKGVFFYVHVGDALSSTTNVNGGFNGGYIVYSSF